MFANFSENAKWFFVLLALFNLSTLISGYDSSTQQNSTQSGAQVSISNACVIFFCKIVKYCTYYKMNYHSVNEYHVKYPNLALSPNSAKLATKQC